MNCRWLPALAVAMLGAAEVDRAPVAVATDGTTLYVAEAGADRVAEVAGGALRREFALPDHPTALAVTGPVLYVAGGDARATVHRLDRASGAITATWPVGHTPTAVVPSVDGSRLFVACRFEHRVEILDTANGTVVARIPVLREPVAAALGADGRLVVANHLPAGRANADVVAAAVTLIDTTRNTVVAHLMLPNGSTSLRGVAVSPDGAFAYVTHLLGRFQQPTTQLERGWMNTNALSIIDVRAASVVGTVLLDGVSLGAANPWGVACTADGATLVVAHAGSHELSFIDRPGLHARLATPAGREAADDLRFLNPLLRRVALTGRGPRAVAVVLGQAVVADYFTGDLEVVDLALGRPALISLGPVVHLTIERRGEQAFNDANRCFQRWQSCASCHPDGRTDGLNWDLMNDGLGNPKNTRNLFEVMHRSPVMSLGVRDSPEKAVRAGFRFIQFATVEDSTISEVMAYLTKMAAVPSPRLVDGRLSPAAERGKAVFERESCTACHPQPRFTNQKKYDFDFGAGMDAGKAFLVPPLLEVWRTAPYLHDGRAATLREVFTTADPAGRHTAAGRLPAADLDDLIAYVESL